MVAVVPRLALVVAFSLRGHRSRGYLARTLEFPWVIVAFEVFHIQVWKVSDVAKPIEVSLGVRFRHH